ncbi:hypothetical protein B296_00051132 [Ensete ventricosum]|uniref:Integrase catalytic domain-containing protein n=1 Tax=Ensete ventricosum TaxID=4639 RepID=A0A426XVC8_ENSVE|nr:hypothetical protein B296_00051132 [Ensete ventricosum]
MYFKNSKLKYFCQSYWIQLKFNLVTHTQANGLPEVTYRAILEGLKRRVAGAQGTWVEKLPSILWASWTIPKTQMVESPYNLAFSTEVVLPPEVVFPTLRVEHFEEKASRFSLRENLDLIEELRPEAHL